jgi:DNA-binding CsgD family transcriptional regulator
MEARAKFETFSAFIFELYERSQVQDAMTVLNWSVQTLGDTVDCDSNWGGWVDLTKDEIDVRGSVSRNLPDDYYRFWRVIKHEDLLAHDVINTGCEVASYNRQGVRHTEGMVALSDRYYLDKLSVIVIDYKTSTTPLFLSSYRSGRNAQPLAPHEMQYLRAAMNHVRFAVERNALSRQGEYDLLVSHSGQVLAASPEALRTLRECWPGWKGDRLPEPSNGRTAGAQLLIRFEKREAPCFSGPPLFYLRLRGSDPLGQLTPREREIVQHIVDGETYKEIARALNISPATVRNHTQAMLVKLGARNKAALIKLVHAGRPN